MKIQILGTDKDLCHVLAVNAEQAAKRLHQSYTIEKVTDLDKIVELGVMIQPALAVDGVIISSGKTPSVEELVSLISSLKKEVSAGKIPDVGDASCPCSTTEFTKGEQEDLKSGVAAPDNSAREAKARLVKGLFLLLIVLSIGYTIMMEMKIRRAEAAKASATEEQIPLNAPSLFVYCFYGNQRDPVESKLEEMTRKVIESKFPKALADGTIIFSRVNLDDPANAHFIKDFQLTDRCIVMQKGIRYEKFDAARNLMDDPARFSAYICNGIRKMK